MSTNAPPWSGAAPSVPEEPPQADAPPQDPLARGLGVFSLALGVPQVAMPGALLRLIGVRDERAARRWMRIVGVREIAFGTGLLTQPRPLGWLGARAAGDVKDLALLGVALGRRPADRRRILGAIGMVAGVTAADAIGTLRHAKRSEPAAEHAPSTKRVKAAITVWKPREEVYGFWHDFRRLPEFMTHLESVETEPGGRSHWTAKAPAGAHVAWDAELVEDRPNELIAWRSLPGAQVANRGEIRFAPTPREPGTEIHLDMEVAIPGGTLGEAVAKVFGEEPETQVGDDLRRFKQLMETGRIVRSDGSPDGVSTPRMVKQRPAQPLETAGVGAEGGAS